MEAICRLLIRRRASSCEPRMWGLISFDSMIFSGVPKQKVTSVTGVVARAGSGHNLETTDGSNLHLHGFVVPDYKKCAFWHAVGLLLQS